MARVQGVSATASAGLVRREARADVRSFSNLGLLSRSDMYASGYVEWDVDMVFEEPEAEPCLPSSSSPDRAARLALGNKRLPPSRTVAQALMLPHALPVVHGTVEETEVGLPTRAAATPSQAAIAPTAPKPSIDTAKFRARVAVTPAHRGAQSCARAHSYTYTYWLITYRNCTCLNAFERNRVQISKRHVQTRSVNVHNIYACIPTDPLQPHRSLQYFTTLLSYSFDRDPFRSGILFPNPMPA
jgi:hypothetical protein